MGDPLNDAEIARILAEDAMHLGVDPGAYYGDVIGALSDDDSDDDYGRPAKKKATKKASKKGKTPPAPAPTASGGSKDDELNGRKKRKDTGAVRTASRSWTDEEERLFLEGLALHGRNWKKCAEHVGTRDHKAISSHCQKYLIKVLLRGEELPPKMQESGRGYTLSGKPLDPNSAAARAYGLKPELFQALADSGFLEVGVHVTTLELAEGPVPPKPPKASKTTDKPAAKKQRQTATDPNPENGGSAVANGAIPPPSANTTTTNPLQQQQQQQKSPLAASQPEEIIGSYIAVEPTEYAKNRPRRQATARTKLGETTESLDLTIPANFVGQTGTGAPLSQPFTVTVSKEALLVMDFHAHLSRCEIIGLLGGRVDTQTRKLEITGAYPCRRVAGSDSSTSVELDAESQVEVSAEMEESGLVPVGWYHSHPIFEARPSQKDNENQRNYQALCRDTATGLEPWIGAIIGPYDQGLPTTASHVQLWVVKMHNGQLAPFNVRAAVTTVKEAPGPLIERRLVTALKQLDGDVGRVDLTATWRPYSRIIMGQPDGGSLTHIEKLRAALLGHLPLTADPTGCASFLVRVLKAIEQTWGVALPARLMELPTLPTVVQPAAGGGGEGGPPASSSPVTDVAAAPVVEQEELGDKEAAAVQQEEQGAVPPAVEFGVNGSVWVAGGTEPPAA